eukprot:CAMPEP_0182598792 /NCGR_PEP_ID=MMETSP1324-20130603/88985_1 /TAXON_ID=236786 /ORGANISM="Florenciella sp., Strain RCC1587" /LENGTH=143 /DNA_ID=CAMNT_0024816649 /DNA_START=15 /DNA_END=443 /DNA_ORIENTATION=+
MSEQGETAACFGDDGSGGSSDEDESGLAGGLMSSDKARMMLANRGHATVSKSPPRRSPKKRSKAAASGFTKVPSQVPSLGNLSTQGGIHMEQSETQAAAVLSSDIPRSPSHKEVVVGGARKAPAPPTPRTAVRLGETANTLAA